MSYSYTNGFLTSAPGYASSISYHPNGMIDQLRHQNGVVDIQAVDASGMARPGEIYTTGANPNWSSGVYAYDGAGNITKIGSDWYLYDGLRRLKDGTASQGVKEQTYAYDGFGNLTSVTTVGVGTQMIGVSATTNRLSGSSYDASGNQLSWGSGGETFSYAYYPTNQIREITGGSPYAARIYGYTADGERIGAYSNLDPDAGITYTLRDHEGHVLRRYLESNGVWTWKEDYIWGPRGLLATDGATDGIKHYTLDHLGSPRLVTSGGSWGGYQLARHDYYPFGQEATSPAQDSERIKFTGQERDLNLTDQTTDDLDYMHARHYAFNIGRFLSVDPQGGKVGLSQSWNRYTYGAENPIRFVDPGGRGIVDATLSAEFYVALLRTRALVDGYVHGGLEAAGAPSVNLGTPTSEAASGDYAAGEAAGAWVARHPSVPLIEGRVGINLKGGPLGGLHFQVGFSLVDFNDPYLILGGGYSRNFSKTLRAGISASLSYGGVSNYRGKGSFRGPFTTSSGSVFPIAFSVAGNPADPSQPSSFTLDLTNSVGFSETETYYVPLAGQLGMDKGTAASTVVRCNGAYHFVDQCQ